MTLLHILFATLAVVILLSLGFGLFFLVKDQGKTKRPLRALIWRISFAVLLMIGILIGIYTGILTPHAVGQ